MRFPRWFAAAAAVLAAACFIGCGGEDDSFKPPARRPPRGTGGSTGTGPSASGKLEPIEAKETAVLMGKVTFVGTPPASVGRSITDDDLFKKADESDRNHCKLDPTKYSVTELTWVVSKDGGVANVAVWVLPGDGKYFKLPETPTWPKEVATDQHFCAFEPHVQLYFPAAKGADNRYSQKSGQVFWIKNSAPIAHNTKYEGSKLANIAGNYNLARSNAGDRVLNDLETPDPVTVVALECSRHPWMRGFVWSLPTPYAAVTDKDGNYKIEGIPAGAPVKVVFWHESAKFFGPDGPKGETMTLNPGDNTKNMKVK